jgi:hypothetical protein
MPKPPQHPRKAVRAIAERWLKQVEAWNEGRDYQGIRIAGPHAHRELKGLGRKRECDDYLPSHRRKRLGYGKARGIGCVRLPEQPADAVGGLFFALRPPLRYPIPRARS